MSIFYTDIEGLSKSELDSILNSDPTHKACTEELKQLKDEFELYKTRTSILHKNRSYKDLTAQLENLDKLKNRNNKLEKRVLELQERHKEKENELNKNISELQNELKVSVKRLTEEKEHQESTYRQKLDELEKQVLNQRERTLELIAEKDAEIYSLRAKSPSASPSGVGTVAFSYPRRYLDPQLVQSNLDGEHDEGESTEETNAAVLQLITRRSGVSGIYLFIRSFIHTFIH